MRICVLGSGSGGNSTFVATPTVRVLFDAGFSCRQIQLRLESIGEDFKDLDAVVISHEHVDHVKGLEVLARRIDVRVYATRLTADVLTWKRSRPEVVTFEAGRAFTIGDLGIETFTISHDAVDPVGFCVRHGGRKLSIATDLGYMTDSVYNHLLDSDGLIIESNHDLEMLKAGPYPWEIKQRVLSRDGHLSNEAVKNYLVQNWDRRARYIALAHLSEQNNHPAIAEMFAQSALDAVGSSGAHLMVASQKAPLPVIQL